MANEMYRMYNEMIEGYKTKNDNMLEHGVRCWLDMHPENPFAPESEAYEVFFRMNNYYNVWRLGGADHRVNRRRMIEAAKQLCALYPKRPYKFDKQADIEDQRIKAIEEEARLKENEEAKAKEIQDEAERIVMEEEKRRRDAEAREIARIEWEENEARLKAEQEKYNEELQKAIEVKRAEIELKREEPVHILGVLPPEDINEPAGLVGRLKHLFKR